MKLYFYIFSHRGDSMGEHSVRIDNRYDEDEGIYRHSQHIPIEGLIYTSCSSHNIHIACVLI